MSSSELELLYRQGVHPAQVVGKKVPPPPVFTQCSENGLNIERNVSVGLRDGVRILVDIYRPEGAAGSRDLPVLLGWSPYGKHNTADRLPWPTAAVLPGWISAYTAFEAPDPAYWCRHGYAVVYPDPRGSWYSQGELRHGGLAEAEDCYDLIEWLAARPWSNGKVGMSGVSYLTAIQWQVAPLRPPHLAAINPWEGFSDWYREFAYHGGIPETSFLARGCANLQWSTTRVEDTVANARAHPLFDAYWRSKECELEAIEVPAYVVASWSDQGLHTRGTLEAYKRLGSRQKWLEVHGRKKWHYYYRPQSVQKQRQFFDHFLKAAATLVPAWPKVLMEVRERANVGEMRAESEWPLARTEFRKLYLNAADGVLTEEPVGTPDRVAYEPLDPLGRVVFDYTFTADAELSGHMKLRLWVAAVGADDMDLFVAVQKLDRDAKEVPFVFYSLNENGPVALGWLRASHRELDPVRSRPEQPFHPHTREQLLAPDEIVAVEIEIWPSATRFAAGERLRVIVQGRDIVPQETPNSPFARHEATRNRGTHVIHAGGQFDSHLLVPWIPPIGTAGASARPDAGNARNELTDAEYREYMAAFNRRDFAHFSSFYAPGVEFQGRGGHFSGRAAVVDFYQQVHARMRETIEIRQIVSSEQGLVADLVTELEALEDWPDFPTGPMTRGQIRRSQNFVWYEVSGKQFTRVRAAHYRRGAVLEVEPAPPAVTVGHSGAGVSAQAFAAYIDAFNRGDEAVYSGFYSPDVRLVIAGNQALVGPRAIVEFYRSVRRQARRTIQVKRVISTPAALAAELESEFTALEDLPDFAAGALRKGDRLQINTVVLYDVRDGQFARIRSARLSKRHWPAL